MIPTYRVLVLVIAAGSLTRWPAPAAARVSANPSSASVGRLGWLGGCWQLRAGTRLVEEQWMAPAGGMMLGMGRTMRDGRVVEFEQLRIFERGGRAVYAASPSGQAHAEFVAAATSDTLVVFENPTHDFPQRIVYRAHGRDSVTARVDGTIEGTPRGTDFRYARTACAGAPA
jgi:hypothetical protein